jgi:ubiquinone/menaquinone biosynthesis C-methylase UbiE
MQSNITIDKFLGDNLAKTAYQLLQQSKSVFSLAHKDLSDRLRQLMTPSHNSKIQSLTPEILDKLKGEYDRILETDWQEAQEGIYPVSLLFETDWPDFLAYYPAVWLDLPQIWQRRQKQTYQQFSPEINLETYPQYYRRNFHYQTDGYLSDTSANLYDLQVEILFNGFADTMRRRILKPLQQGLSKFDDYNSPAVRVLDLACGTGRTLKLIRATLPKASLFGVDLSPAYLRKANQLLSEIPGELPQLIQANGENLPYQDQYFHALTSIFLFHELPPSVRQRVIAECFRVIQPGGIFVICDSIQMIDSAEFKPMMENFAAIFHEPYYLDYINDDLRERLEKVGFINIQIENHLASKYWIAYKPV